MFIATLRDGAYDFVLLLHIATAIVGFGGVLLNPIYGIQAKNRPGPGGLAVTEANYAANRIAEKFIYAVPIFGFALVGMSDSAWEFSQTWIWLAIVLYVVGLGIAHSVLIPTQKRMIAMMQAGPPDPAAMEEQAKKLQTFGPINDVVLVIILILMIWKPGL
jgi:uncharacterized membrane protein